MGAPRAQNGVERDSAILHWRRYMYTLEASRRFVKGHESRTSGSVSSCTLSLPYVDIQNSVCLEFSMVW